MSWKANASFGLVLQRKPELDSPTPEDLHEFGCAGRVLKMLKFPDNTVRVLVEGLWRIRITAMKPRHLSSGQHRCLEGCRPRFRGDDRAGAHAHRQFQEIVKLTPALSDQVKIAALNTEAPGALTDLIAANLNLNLEERQKLLEIYDVKERLLHLKPLMERELEVLNLAPKSRTT